MSAEQVLAEAGWRSDMEAAPRDGTPMDLWVYWPEHDRARRVPDAWWDEDDNDWRLKGLRPDQYQYPPTILAWKPLDTPDQPDPVIALCQRLLEENKAQAAELSRLKEPLGDEGKAIIGLLASQLRHAGAVEDRAISYIEHQAAALTLRDDREKALEAALAQPVPEAVEELAERLDDLAQTYCDFDTTPWEAGLLYEAAQTLRTLSRANTRLTEGVAKAREYHLIKMVAHAAHHCMDDSDYDEFRECVMPRNAQALEDALNAWEAEFPSWHDTMDETRAVLSRVVAQPDGEGR